MKKKLLFIPILTIIFIFALLPLGYLNANPGNLVKNGSFSDGLNHWDTQGTVSPISGQAYTEGTSGNWTGPYQDINTSNKKLTFSLDVYPTSYGSSGEIDFGFSIYKSNWDYIGEVEVEVNPQLNKWTNYEDTISDMWKGQHGGASLPDFSYIIVWPGIWSDAKAYFDNIKLTYPEKEAVEEGFIRTMPMTCYQVWVNSDNKFEFVFWYPYRDNNWVKIYDMNGKQVYSVDMPLDDPHIIVDLPNGMYTVKTFNDQPEPLQTFVIGK